MIQARQIYDEQLPFISKILSAAVVGMLDLMMKWVAVSIILMHRFIQKSVKDQTVLSFC